MGSWRAASIKNKISKQSGDNRSGFFRSARNVASRIKGRRFQRVTVISYGLLSFLLGLIIARRVSISDPLTVVTICIASSPLLLKRNILSVLSIICIGLILGCWRGSVFLDRLLPYKLLEKQKITVKATVTSDAVYGDKGQISFDAGALQVVGVDKYSSIESWAQDSGTIMIKQVRHQGRGQTVIELPGTIGVKGYGTNMVYRGDVVYVTAKLYLTRGSKQGGMAFAQIEKLSEDTSAINSVRRRFASGLQSAIPEPLGSLGLGILIGQRSTLPKSLDRDMSTVGLTHIVAVSGYNMTILVNLAQRMAQKRSRYQALILTVSFIGLFLLVTGNAASIVRAGIVSMLSIWAWYYGRAFKPVPLILLSAVITAGWFPVYLWSDLGWHLSFLAFIGVLLLSPLFQARFFKKKPRILVQLLVETTAAQILTLPIILYIFARLSVISLIANLMVVPVIPFAMLAGFVAGLAGMILPNLAGWVAWPATILITYMVDVVALLAKIPNAQTSTSMSVWQMMASYGLMLVLMLVWWRKTRKNGKITNVVSKPLTEPIVATRL